MGRGGGRRNPRGRLHDPHDLGAASRPSANRSIRSSTGHSRTCRARSRRWASSATRRRRRRAARKDDETIARSKDPNLAHYLKKRSFGDQGTPEPAGGGPSPGGNSFVIQWHDATRLHHDYRLERNGVLVSWAVPKGLPWEPGEKHLAVQTEDHPMEYGTFAGSIPSGHYGAGEVRIWDNGTYDLHGVDGVEGERPAARPAPYRRVPPHQDPDRLARLPGQVLGHPAAGAAAVPHAR